jgi:predicted anti-sigma-YlaC factor YlaD
MSKEELVELLLKKAAEPPPEANLILARHLQCRESRDLAQAVAEAIRQYVAPGSYRLPTPPELLPPLG